jgi:hypothetical protein
MRRPRCFKVSLLRHALTINYTFRPASRLPVSYPLKFHMKNCYYTKVAHFPANRCHTSLWTGCLYSSNQQAAGHWIWYGMELCPRGQALPPLVTWENRSRPSPYDGYTRTVSRRSNVAWRAESKFSGDNAWRPGLRRLERSRQSLFLLRNKSFPTV